MADKKARRNTRQRQVVLEELKKLTSHPTAAELYEIARRRLPKLSLGTVYRNLELLAADGAIQKLDISGTESRFDGNPERHYHVRCVRCGRVDDLHGVPGDLVGDRFKTWGGIARQRGGRGRPSHGAPAEKSPRPPPEAVAAEPPTVQAMPAYVFSVRPGVIPNQPP